MKLKNFKLSCKIQKNNNPKTYYKFEFINFEFINTSQVWCFNLTIFNIWVQLLYEKNEEDGHNRKDLAR
jgi:hypothetical protein